MALSATLISATNFNNNYFTRYLNTSLVTYTTTSTGALIGNQLIYWTFPTFAVAYSAATLTPNNRYPAFPAGSLGGINFLSGAVAAVSSLSTLYFTFTATSYKDSTESYTLCSLPINCTLISPLSYTGASPYIQIFDTFPEVDLDVYINYENTLNSSFFYRLTSTNSYPVTANFTSSSFDQLSSTNIYRVTYTLNNSAAANANNLPTSFVRTLPGVSSIGITVSALSADNSYSPWYTPHIIEQALSANFVPYFLSASFIGFTDTVFSDNKIYKVDSSNFANVLPTLAKPLIAGLEFLGEGHVANITLSAGPDSRIVNYNWNIGAPVAGASALTFNTFPFSAVSYNYYNELSSLVDSGTLTTTNSIVTAIVDSTPSVSEVLPITLLVTDNTFFRSSSPPTIFYDDLNGTPSFYSYFSSTLNISGTEDSANTPIRKSIVIDTYDTSNYILYPNINSNIYLPPNGSPFYYESNFTPLTASTNVPCYDKYGLIWNWSTLLSANVASLNTGIAKSSAFVAPSSWSMTQFVSSCGTTLNTLSTIVVSSSGSLAKTWGYEGVQQAATLSPVSITGTGISWSIKTNNWTYPIIPFTNNATTTFDYTLQLSGAGTTTTTTGGTLPTYIDTAISLEAQQTVTAYVSSAAFAFSPAVNDYIPRDILLTPSTIITAVGQPRSIFYTPNRFVLTGSNIIFENVSTKSNFISSFKISFDDVPSFSIPASATTFTVSTCSIGFKNLTVTSYTTYPNLPVIVTTFPNIVEVVAQYDVISPLEYRTQNSPIVLPWSVLPQIGSNDWVNDDNINSSISKIYDNLQYLNSLGKTYSNTYSDYFGYLAPVNYNTINTPAITAIEKITCPRWTWENLNCNITPRNNITWTTLSGTNIDCGTWQDQICYYRYTVPAIYYPEQVVTVSTSLPTPAPKPYTVSFRSGQKFTVPDGVNSITITAFGGGGGGGGANESSGYKGGAGQVVSGTITVTPGDILTIGIGGGGTGGANYNNGGGAGRRGVNDVDSNFNGGPGGNAGGVFTSGAGGGGGAATFVKLNGKTIIVAAGGGGGGGGGMWSPGQPQNTNNRFSPGNLRPSYTNSGRGGNGADAGQKVDGGGGGGGGGGYRGGVGGGARIGPQSSRSNIGDLGGASGTDGQNLIPVRFTARSGVNGGIQNGGLGGKGSVTIKYTVTPLPRYSVYTNLINQFTIYNTLDTYTVLDVLSTAPIDVAATAAPNTIVCEPGTWNVNIPGLDDKYNYPFNGDVVNSQCIYTGIVSKNNTLYTTLPTQITLLSSDYNATVQGIRNTLDDVRRFNSIQNICLDSAGKIFVLDGILNQVVTLTVDDKNNWEVFNSWGGFGFASAHSRFNQPRDIHVDQLDNVWICDTGNNAIKHYSNTGTWLQTINDTYLKQNTPISITVDGQQILHVLTKNGNILTYDYAGNYITSYSYTAHTTSATPRRICASYSREMIYVALDTQVLKFFRTGVFAGYIIKNQPGVTNINSIYQDEYRNVLITTDNIILKYSDLMQLLPKQGDLPPYYWKLDDLLIDKNEYVQNWVYTKSFQRLWDNIEYTRNTLLYTNNNCQSYTPPPYDKSKMIIGQNEILTSTVVNRVIGYLWSNFYTLIKYFDPNCKN